MWFNIHQLLSPKSFYDQVNRWQTPVFLCGVIGLAMGLTWGLCFAPADYQQGDAFRMIYVHVPCAFLSMGIYSAMGIFALLRWVWKVKIAGLLLRSSAFMGLTVTLLALCSGSLWGRPMWGAWWVWDARLTSELILFFLYLAIVLLGQVYPDEAQGDGVLAILTLVGCVDLPIIHYSVNWWNTLHQGATLSFGMKPKIDSAMLYPLLITLSGLTLYCLSMVLRKTCNALILRERRCQWVRELFND